MIESPANANQGDSPEELKRPVCQPNVDILETDAGLLLRADLPGVTKETLDLVIEDNVLKIFGRSVVHLPEDAKPAHYEFRLGDFYRSFILGDEIDSENIKAELENGVLSLKLPKRKVRPRRIEVE
jgi:HSP20 family molecular chaperone IbpA